MTKFSEENTDRQGSSSVEVEKMKIERSKAEGTHGGSGDDSQLEGSCASQESEWEK